MDDERSAANRDRESRPVWRPDASVEPRPRTSPIGAQGTTRRVLPRHRAPRRPTARGRRRQAQFDDGDLYFTSGPATQKSRNLASNPACTISVKFPGLDLTIEGEAERVTDRAVLDRMAARYRELGWPAEVDGDAFSAPYSAPSAGPPPWHLYRFRIGSAVGVSTTEPNGATRWRFA